MGAPPYAICSKTIGFRISYWSSVAVSNLPGPHVFSSERGGPIAPKSFHKLKHGEHHHV